MKHVYTIPTRKSQSHPGFSKGSEKLLQNKDYWFKKRYHIFYKKISDISLCYGNADESQTVQLNRKAERRNFISLVLVDKLDVKANGKSSVEVGNYV